MSDESLTPRQRRFRERQKKNHKNWTISPTMRKKFTSDWAAMFPGLEVYKPMWLLRRIGPIVQGVLLDRESSGEFYRPTLHVHCLARPFPTISLGMCSRLLTRKTGAEQSIRSFSHEDLYRDAAERLRNQSPLSLDGPLRLNDVLKAYRLHMATPLGVHSAYSYDDMLRLMALCGRTKEARIALETYYEDARSWPNDARWNEWLAPSADEWRAQCQTWIANPRLLERIVEDQVAAHKLGKLPVSELIPE